MEDLIEIKQLPIIKEQLKTVSEQIDEEVKNATSLVCNEETIKTIKELRASLNKEFKEFETKRKDVKEKIMGPYMEFEGAYKEYVSDKFKNADAVLKQEIDSFENEVKAEKEQEVKDYFEVYKASNNIDFVTFEQVKINVTLSASMKSLKEQAKEFIDKVIDDLKLIETQEHKAEILVEYKQSLNVSQAITTVTSRFKAVEEEKMRKEKQKEKELQETLKPVEIEETKHENNEFVITPTKRKIKVEFNLYDEQITQLKKFLELSNIEYESEDL